MKHLLLITSLSLLLGHPVLADYADLMEEWEAYAPPIIWDVADRPQHDTPTEPPDEAFTRQMQQLEEQKTHWETLLAEKQAVDAPWFPAQQILVRLKPAGRDASAAAVILKKDFALEDLETLAVLRNQKLASTRSLLRASLESFSQVAQLDNVLRQYSAYTQIVMPGVGPMKGNDPIAMKFPFPGVLGLKGQVAQQEVYIAGENLAAARRDTITAARKAFWELLYNASAQKIIRDTIQLFDQLEAVATTRYEGGRTSFQDVIKVRINRKTLEEDLVTLKEKQLNLETTIRDLVNLPANTPVGSPQTRRPQGSVPDIGDLHRTALEHRQELRRLRARISKMERMIELAETMIQPPYTSNLSLRQNDAGLTAGPGAVREGFNTTVSPQIGTGLPKSPWFGTQDAYLRETRQKLNALREELHNRENKTVSLVRSAWFDLDRAKRERTLYRNEIVNLSQAALEVSTRGYESGKVSFADVIGSYSLWLNANLALKRKTADVGTALAELAKTVGRDI